MGRWVFWVGWGLGNARARRQVVLYTVSAGQEPGLVAKLGHRLPAPGCSMSEFPRLTPTHSGMPIGAADWRGESHLTSGTQRWRAGKRARIACEPPTRPRSPSVDLRASGDVVALLAVGGREPCRDESRSGRVTEVRRLPGVSGLCPRRGRWDAVADPFTRLRRFVKNRGGVPCCQQDESGLGEREILTFLATAVACGPVKPPGNRSLVLGPVVRLDGWPCYARQA